MSGVFNYRLRGFNQANLADIELVNLMGYHPSIMKAKGYGTRGFGYIKDVNLQERDRDIFAAKTKMSRKYEDILFGVADKQDKIVGWIWFYRDASHPLPAKVVTELTLTPRNSRIYQISYEKLMSEGWPAQLVEKAQHITPAYLKKTRKGIIVGGLKLAMASMKRMYRKLYVRKRSLVFYAFTHPTNIASRKVLEYNGFTRNARKYSYDGVPHYLWVKVV
jgi:hypothetical protein